MSLDWNVSGIKDCGTVCWVPAPEGEEGERMHPVTNTIIWATIGVGIGRMTEENVEEFAYRLNFWERIFGELLVEGGKKRFVTFEEVKRHVGLKTNVSFETRTEWKRRVQKHIMQEYDWQASRWLKDQKKALEVVSSTS